MMWALASLFCLFLGAVLGWLFRGGQAAAREAELAAKLEGERQRSDDRARWHQETQATLASSLKAASQDALLQSNQAFLQLAEQRLEPVRTALASVDQKIHVLEQARVGAYEKLQVQVKNLNDGQTRLRDETARLVSALRSPTTRGQWGESQLRRVVEMAGMVEHCDFSVQLPVATGDGVLRPDLIVHMPGNRKIVVDAKAPLMAYLEALESSDEAGRRLKLDAHAAHVRQHMQALGRKAYSEHFQPSPDFVVMFLPGESFFSAALERDPTLMELALQNRVILTSPTTLIALLRTVAYVWQQQMLAENAVEIQKLGVELHASLRVMMNHWGKVGGQLDKLVRTYNETTGSLEQRVLVKARRLEEMGAAAAGNEIASPPVVERTVRGVPESSEDIAKLFKAASGGPAS